jgi:protein PhnA
MNTEQALMERSHSSCELCTATTHLAVFEIPPNSDTSSDQCILLCRTCLGQIQQTDSININHWRCLNDSMWSQVPAVQVMAWRQLKRLSEESWAQDLLNMLYLEDNVQAWAQALEENINGTAEPTVDSNGAILEAGDTVILIKDLNVKGAGFTAKRGTAVRGISLTSDPSQIEGRVNGTRIVLLSKFLKKSN